MNILQYAKLLKVLVDTDQIIKGKKTLTSRLHTKDVYVGGYFDENGAWQDSEETSSSLNVSGTVNLEGEVHADNASFHTHHMNVGGELKVAGDARFNHEVRMTNSLRVDAKADIREGATIRGTLDMKDNDIKNVQSLKVNGTLDTYNDIKMKPNTGREDRVKLSDALNEALDHTFKNRIQIDGNDVGGSGGTFTDRLNTALSLVETTSASIIDLKDGGTYEWTQPIVLTKSVTFKGSKKNKAVLHFNLSGVESGDEVEIFRITSPDVVLEFDNVELIIDSEIEPLYLDIPWIQLPTYGLEYTLSEDKSYYIVSGKTTNTDTEFTIPSQYAGKPVKAIADGAFKYRTDFTKVIISKGITHIGNNAFNDCDMLGYIYIPNTVEYIGDGAFDSCEGSEDNNLKIYCEAASQPASWNATWNSYNDPVVWGATIPGVGLKLNNFAIRSKFSRYWPVTNCNVSIVNSLLTADDEFHGVAASLYYCNNDGSQLPSFTGVSCIETPKLDFFRGDLLVNGSRVLTEADNVKVDIDEIAEAVIARIPNGDEVSY